jgi:hypothetical protein
MARRKIDTTRSKNIVVMNHKKDKPEWELVYEENNPQFDDLVRIYKENPFHARVVYFQSNTGRKYERKRVVSFTFPNGDINIINFRVKLGISITNRIYESKKNESSIIFKKATGKWYLKSGSMIRLLTYGHLTVFPGYSYWDKNESPLMVYMIKKLGWIRNLPELRHDLVGSLSFNTIIENKLFNIKSIYRHVFKVPYPIGKILVEVRTKQEINGRVYGDFLRTWHDSLRVLKNVESLSVEFLSHAYFDDTCRMAYVLGKTVNCSWGINRLKSEHDTWAREISKIILTNEPLRELKVRVPFIAFAEFSGFDMFTTNHSLVNEGLRLNHCVGTYASNIDSGGSGIYSIGDYTLELGRQSSGLFIKQFKGFGNVYAPKDVVGAVTKCLDDFNRNIYPTLSLESDKEMDDELPF